MSQMDNNNYCVIMAGGVGARFWPLSRTSKPKQFIDILGVGKSLIQLTIVLSKIFILLPMKFIMIWLNNNFHNYLMNR